MEPTKTTFKHPGDLDSEIWEWLKEHGTEETKQVIMMTARHFAGFIAAPIEVNFEDIEFLLDKVKYMSGLWVKTNPDCTKIINAFNGRLNTRKKQPEVDTKMRTCDKLEMEKLYGEE